MTKISRPSNETIAVAVCVVAIAILLLVAAANPQNPALGTILGILGGIIGGFLLALILYLSQTPSFVVTVAKDEFNPKLGGMYFLHVVIKNQARGFLGGGTATDCEGIIQIESATFTPKWATRPEPLSWHLIPIQGNQLQAVPWIDWALMDECKFETLGPQEEKTLDIAVKVEGDESVYIHEPKNYEDTKHKRNPYPPGTHHLLLTLKYRGGQSTPFKLRLDNDKSLTPDSVRLALE
jgi:hypothetical protein